MAQLELLVSPPGTGKTTHCIELFRNKILKSKGGIDSRSFFILPSREHADRIQNLVLKKEVSGLFNAHILTINDFASKLIGASAGLAPTDAVRRKLLQEILENKALKFQAFDQMRDFKGFHQLLADTIKEFKSNLLSIAEFETLAQSLLKDPVFRSKFRDFSMVFKSYEAALKERGLSESEDDIAHLLEENEDEGPLDLVIFDGFYHFTRAQRLLIRAVTRRTQHTVVTLTLPFDDLNRPSLFDFPLRTKQALLAMGFKEKRGILKENRRTQEEALRHLERGVFSKEPDFFRGDASSIEILEAPSVREEVQMIARQIKRLRREGELHYSDICVLLRSVSEYENVLHSVFRDFQIPVNIHERKKLSEQGFATTLFRFFNLSQEDWRREDLLAVLKSSYLRGLIRLQDALDLEAVAVKRNILNGREKWLELLEIREVEKGVKDVLKWAAGWEEKFLAAKTFKEFAGHLEAFISQFGIKEEEGFASSCDELERADQLSLKTVESLMRNARPAAGSGSEGDFSARAFMRELQESMEGALFSLKPRGKNRVQVYDVVMALPKEYKVVFVAGLLEKKFPQALAEDPLFKDSERRVINKKEVVLEERLWRAAGERFFFYMALNRAKEKLILTYPLYDSDGRPSLPSFFVQEVKRCFKKDALKIVSRDLDETLPGPMDWETEDEITRGLSYKLFHETLASPGLAGVLNDWKRKEPFREILRLGLAGETAVISDEKAKRVFLGFKGPFSATRLETYATCAFKYFSQRVLNLNEPLEGRESLEMGNLLHRVLEEFYKELPLREREGGSFWKDVDKARKTLHEKLEALFPESPFRHEPLYRQKTHLAQMRTILSAFASEEKESSKTRDLVPAHFELEFGMTKGALNKKGLDYLRIPGQDHEILIEGKIDRVDLTRDGKRALVIDYKLSEDSSTLRKNLAQGTELQVPLYLLAVQKLLGMEALGGEIHSLKKSKKGGLYRESARDLLGLGRKSAYADEEFQSILSKTETLTGEVVSRLQKADISVRSKSCQYCPYSSVCRFEPWRLVYFNEEPDES